MTSSDDHQSNAGGPPDDLNGMRVLIVDDSWDVAAALTELLESWGVDVLGAVATPADALRLVSERTVDVALVDINLRGGERAHELIDHLYGRGLRIVVISGYTNVPLAAAKVAAILQKPVQPDLLLQILRSGPKKEIR
jgi:DNA-binding NtrC family response regulator